jgi:hypothetical protein
VRQEYYYFYLLLHAELLVMYLKQCLQIRSEHAYIVIAINTVTFNSRGGVLRLDVVVF